MQNIVSPPGTDRQQVAEKLLDELSNISPKNFTAQDCCQKLTEFTTRAKNWIMHRGSPRIEKKQLSKDDENQLLKLSEKKKKDNLR